MWVNTWINAIGEAGSTSNMFIGGYLQSPSSYSQYMINRYGDNDSDGIADVLETNGMINNIGHVVYLNPETAYTDEDGLTDGIEMGVTGSLSEIFGRSPYTQYKNSWPVSAGSRWEDCAFYKCSSDATLSDTDFDGANDDEDATVNDLNKGINYLLYDVTDTICLRPAKAYYNYLIKHDMSRQALPIYSEEQFIYFFENLEYGFEEDVLNTGTENGGLTRLTKKHYSYVENIIIIFHGNTDENSGYFNTAKDIKGRYETVYAKDLQTNLSRCSEISIKSIDYHCCYAAKYSSDIKSLVVETLLATNAEVVYGATGKIRFAFGFTQVWGGTYDRYFVNDRGNIEKWGGFLGYNILDRYPCVSDYSHEITDYPL